MKFSGREALQIENDLVRVTVTKEGGHVVEILHKKSGVNPLWIPPWKSIEPSTYDPARNPQYGGNAESKLLAGIMGHNLCLDMFGPPSAEEAEAGLSVHGEGSVVPYELTLSSGSELRAATTLPLAGLKFERTLRLEKDVVHFRETVGNLSALDRAIAWTEHVTIGPPFLENGVTQVSHSGSRSEVYGPLGAGGSTDVFASQAKSGGFAAHLMDPKDEEAFFEVSSPRFGVALSYRWQRTDFPWLGIWEENRLRTDAPWDGRTMTWGMEFGVSPFPETRREMIDRGQHFNVPGFRWLPARKTATVEYTARVFAKRTPD